MELSVRDRELLDGRHGEAARFAASIVVRMAEVLEAERLLTIEQAHIDACALMSVSSRDVVRFLADRGGRVCVPTTLSMVSLDLEGWGELGIDAGYADMAGEIARAYTDLGCIPTWTCAPYQGYLTPRFGQQVAWGESNAVAYANSVLGARTERYADYLDICAAIVGRVPHAGLHRSENRIATVHFRVAEANPADWETTAAWACLGSLVGRWSGSNVPVIDGLPPLRPSNDMLKAFGASAASAGAVGLFHLVGVTPEAPDLRTACGRRTPPQRRDITRADLSASWKDLAAMEEGSRIDAVILGCPHFSYQEFEALTRCFAHRTNQRVHENVQFLVFAGGEILELVRRSGWIDMLRDRGVTIVRDTCPFHSPVVDADAARIMTNSGKCAYYAPGELDVTVGFDSLDRCVEAAINGRIPPGGNPWRSN